MGGPAAEHNNFWQLFVRPAATGKWRLATPPGVASNGGLVVASLGAGSVVAGFRPSQDLSYSPLATTHDNGTAWTPGLLDAALADVPDALAAAPGGGHLLALLASGQAELSGPGGTGWTRLATRQSLAASPAGRQLRAGQPHRRGVQPIRGSPAGRQLHPPRDRRHLRLRQRDVAPGRTHAPGHVRTPGRSPSSGSPPPPAPPRRCWRPAPDQRHTCWPPGPPAAVPTGPCRRRCRCTAPNSHRPRPGPAAPWRWC